METLGDARRNLSQTCLNALAKVLLGLLRVSVDLASSNMTIEDIQIFLELNNQSNSLN